MKSLRWAAAFVIVLGVISACTAAFGWIQGPVFVSFVPMAGLLWCAADLVTAYLLLSHFRSSNDSAYLGIGAAYFVTGMLTIPYIIFFPGTIVSPGFAETTGQISIFIWACWHLGFPLIIGMRQLLAASNQPYMDPGRARVALIRTGLVTCFLIAIVVAGCWFDRASLPIFIANGNFTQLFVVWIAPAVVLMNTIVAVMLLRSSSLSTLQLWLGVALLSGAMDGFLNAFSPGRYSLPWYFGKFETIATASVVLAVLLTEVSQLYKQLGRLAHIDSLTGLSNRRAFDDNFARVVAYGRRAQDDIAFLIADVDFFKAYNDFYGHAAGDECLRRVAHAVNAAISRDTDLVGRYGGEEFVVLLPATTIAGAFAVAERLRSGIEALQIAHERSDVARVVTVSIGVCATKIDGAFDALALYKSADRALYLAKQTRNNVGALAYEGSSETDRPMVNRSQ